jgi:hypothetical protein
MRAATIRESVKSTIFTLFTQKRGCASRAAIRGGPAKRPSRGTNVSAYRLNAPLTHTHTHTHTHAQVVVGTGLGVLAAGGAHTERVEDYPYAVPGWEERQAARRGVGVSELPVRPEGGDFGFAPGTAYLYIMEK